MSQSYFDDNALKQLIDDLRNPEWVTTNNAVIANWKRDYAYMGFDPTHLAGLALQRAANFYNNNTALLKTGQSIDEAAVEIVQVMICIGIFRGTKLKKIESSLSDKAKEMFLRGIAALGIKEGNQVKGVALRDKDLITMNRLGLCFPLPTIEIVKTMSGLAVTPSTVQQTDALLQDYPACMCHPAFASLIPKKAPVRDEVIKAYYVFAIMFAKVSSKLADYDGVDYVNLKKFTQNGFNSELIQDSTRVQFCLDHGIVTASTSPQVTANIQKIVTYYNQNFSRFIGSNLM